MKYLFTTDITALEHDDFVRSHPLCNLLQSSSWAKVKDNWSSMFVGVKEQDQLVASAMILIKPLPLSLCMYYIPRGPVMDFENQELLAYFLNQLKNIAKKKHCIYITMDPALHCNDYTLDEVNEERYPLAQSVIHCFRHQGAIFKGFTKTIEDTIQPRFHANVYRNDAFFEALPKATKKNLKIAEKKMVMMESCGIEAISTFAYVMQFTEERKNIQLRGEEYFRKIMNAYGDDARIMLAKIPLRTLFEATKERYDKTVSDLENCPENAKKKRFTLEELHTSLSREVHELKALIDKHGDYVFTAGALVVKFGNTAEILYAGMDDTFKRYMAPYAVFYTCMQWSFEKGCAWCNMGGIEGDFKDGLTKFKSNFNPIINEFIGEFDLPVSKILYHVAMKALALRKK